MSNKILEVKWRTVRDSNSRYRYQYASLAGMWFQPTHPTVLCVCGLELYTNKLKIILNNPSYSKIITISL